MGRIGLGKYLEPSLCTSVTMEDEENHKKIEKTEKARSFFLPTL